MSLWRLAVIVTLILIHSFSYSKNKPQDELLWEQGRSQYLSGEWKTSLHSLEQLTKKYPASQYATESLLLIALSYQRLKEYKKAIEPIKKYISRKKLSPEAVQARLILTRIYLDLKLFSEAALLSQEIIQIHSKNKQSHDLYLETLLTKAQSEIGLNNISKSKTTLQDYYKERGKDGHSLLDPEASFIEMSIESKSCETLSQKTTPDEGVWIVKTKKLGSCYLEMQNNYKKILRSFNDYWIKESTSFLLNQWKNFSKNCTTISYPTAIKLSADQKKEYTKETLPVIQKQCKEIFRSARESIEKWEKEIFEAKHHILKQLLELLKERELKYK